MDENKWIDNVLCLNESAKKLLLGMHAIKQILKKPNQLEKELFIDDILFKPIAIKEFKTQSLEILTDASLSSVRKAIIKSFPNGGIRNHQINCQSDLKPFYNIICHSVDFLEFSNLCMQQSLKFIKLSNSVNPQLSQDLLCLISFYSSIVYFLASMNSEFKVLAVVYMQQSRKDTDAHWTRISKLLCRLNKPHEYLLESLECVIPKIVPLIIEYSNDVDQMVLSAHEMRKSAMLSLIPDLSGVKAPELDSNFLRNLGNSKTIFKNLTLAILIIPFENLKQTGILQTLLKLLSFSTRIPIFRSESIDLINSLDSGYLSRMKSILSNASSNFLPCWQFHAERRHYLRYQLRQIQNIRKEEEILVDKFSIVVTALCMAKNEILWYFRNLDQIDLEKKTKNVYSLDMNIFELMNTTISVGEILMKNENAIISKQIEKLKEPCLVCCHLISSFIETNRLSKTPYGLLLQEIWRVLDSISHNGDNRNDFKAMRMNWRRFQGLISLSAGLINDPLYAEIVKSMTEIIEYSVIIDSYPSYIKSKSSLRELYYYLPNIKEHVYMVLESFDSEIIRHLECSSMILDVCTDNASSSWPEEFYDIAGLASYFGLEFYSLVAKIAAYCVDRICMIHVDHSLQFLPEKTVQFFAKPQPDVLKRKNTKNIVKTIIRRPGWESKFKQDADTSSQKQLIDLRSCAVSLIAILSKTPTVTISQSVIEPGVYFAEYMREKMKEFLRGCINGSGSSKIDRPSVLSIKIRAYISSFYQNSFSMAMLSMPYIHEVLQDAVSPQRSEFLSGKNYSVIAGYYECYSCIQEQQFDLFVNKNELRALKELIGDQGVEYFQSQWLTKEFMHQIQNFTSMNFESMVKISSEWINDSTFEQVKKLKGMANYSTLGVKDLIKSVDRIGFRIMVLHGLGATLPQISETNKDIPLVFAIIILLNMSDEKYLLEHAEWIMHSAFYTMQGRPNYKTEFINFCTRVIIYAQEKKFHDEKTFLWTQILCENCYDPSQIMFALPLPVSKDLSTFIDETELSL